MNSKGTKPSAKSLSSKGSTKSIRSRSSNKLKLLSKPNSPKPLSASKFSLKLQTTDIHDFFNNSSLHYEDFLNFLNSKKNCTSQISSPHDINKVYKTCSHRVANCSDCIERLAIKLFKGNTNEGHILKEISDGIKKLPPKFQNYKNQIIEFRDFTSRGHTDILVTALVETGPNKILNFKQYLDSGLPISSDSFN